MTLNEAMKFAENKESCGGVATHECIELLYREVQDLRDDIAKLITDGKMLDWLDENLISLYHQGPYMDGCNIGGQLRNPGPSAGSYFRVHHRKIRIALQEAMNQAGSI